MIKFIYLFIAIQLFITGCSTNNMHYSMITEHNKVGVINQDGYIIIKPTYKQILTFDSSEDSVGTEKLSQLNWIGKNTNLYAIVQSTNNKYGVINQSGKLLLKPVYDSLTYFFDGFMKIEVGGNFGLVDKNFKIILKPIYTSISEFTGDIAIVEHKGHFGCINKKMDLKIKPTYQTIYFQQEDFLRTRLNGKWGYLDNKCNVLSKAIYDYGYDFSNGFAKVLLDNKIGYLKGDGTLLQKNIFSDESSSF